MSSKEEIGTDELIRQINVNCDGLLYHSEAVGDVLLKKCLIYHTGQIRELVAELDFRSD